MNRDLREVRVQAKWIYREESNGEKIICKGSEAEACLMCFRASKEANVARGAAEMGNLWGPDHKGPAGPM